MPELELGTLFAGHRIESVAGRGGMGIVYRATHLALDHVVALKVISPELAADERFRRRFVAESRIAVSIRHPNVVPVHHAGEEDGLLFVTMDLIEGSDLRGLVSERGPLEPAGAARLLSPVCSALDAAHARGLVHRDIKPGNILVERRDGGEHVFLTDFGLTKRLEASTGVTATGAFVGTLDYVAPEQIRGDRVDARADVYALGCVLFELLAGQPPFADRTEKVAKMYAHLQDDPPLVRQLAPRVPRELDRVVRRAMAKDPASRFPSAGDLARATAAAVAGEPTVEAERSVATGAAAPVTPSVGTTSTEAAWADGPPATPLAPDRGATTAAPVPTTAAGRGRVLRRLVPAGIGAIAIAAAAIALLSSRDDTGEAPAHEPQGGGASAPRARLAAQPIGVGRMPVGIAHGDGVWTANRNGASISRVDPRRDTARQIPVAGSPEAVAVDRERGAVWVSDGDGATVTRIEIRNPSRRRTFPVGAQPGELAIGAGAVWVANSGSGSVSRIDLDAGGVETIDTGQLEPYGVAIGAGDVWVTNRGSGTVSRIDGDTGSIVSDAIAVGANPKGITVHAGAVWVANTDDDQVTRLELGRLEPEQIEVGDAPRGIVAAFDSIWVANGEGDSVTRIDASTGRVMQTIGDVGSGPEGITAGPDFVWVANGLGDSVQRVDPGGG